MPTACIIVPSLRSGKISCGSGIANKRGAPFFLWLQAAMRLFLFAIPLTLHYLCSNKRNHKL
jgi:hypothetical protein